MKCLPLVFVMYFAVTACFAFTQCRVEFHSPRLMQRITFEKAMVSNCEYCESADITFDDEREFLKSRMPAPINEDISKYQVEFRELLTGILYTDKELQTVLKPRMRTILEGIAASYYEHDVYRAFEILYEDYVPLRLAGRVVYRELRKVMDESRLYQQSQIDTIMKVTGMKQSDVEECWGTYMRIANGQEISLGDLESYMGPQALKLALNSSSLSVTAESEEPESISFEQLLIFLHNSNMRYGHDDNYSSGTRHLKENPSGGNILEQALKLSDGFESRDSEKNLSSKRQKYNQRYDDMLVQFAKWKPLIPSGDGRRLEILKGCFTGSENSAVVEALRIIYVDYAALRLSGDWIFKVVSTLMGPIVRRHNRRQKRSLKP